MRLRKIGLGNPYHPCDGYGGLFFPTCKAARIYLPNALGMFVDKVTPAEKKAVREHFKRHYRFSSSVIRKSPRGNLILDLFSDYSTTIADNEGRKAGDSGVQNRNALLVISSSKVNSSSYHFSYAKVGEYEGYYMEAPIVRGGAPEFEGINAYIEIANGGKAGEWNHSDPALSVLEKTVHEFETPVHQRVFKEILAGERNKFTDSALYQCLHETGQKEKW